MPAAIGRFKNLLSNAKAAANSWNQRDIIEELKKIDDETSLIINRTHVEEWSINKAVHYNEWANFSKEDFFPVFSAFKELYERVFSCANAECQSVLQVTFDGAKIIGVRYKCGGVNWNLTKEN